VPHSLKKRAGGFRQFAQQVLQRRKGRIWRWDYAKGWALLSLSELDRIYPGQVFLLEASCGGYDIATGWTGNSEDNPWKIDSGELRPWEKDAAAAQFKREDPDLIVDSDALSETGQEGPWRDILAHTQEVCDDLDSLLRDSAIAASVPDSTQKVLRLAARLHDWGKAHEAFQAKIKSEARGSEDGRRHSPIAKAPDECWRGGRLRFQAVDAPEGERDHRRPRFRHELASALGVLELLRRAKPSHDAVSWPDDELRIALGVEEHSDGPWLPTEAGSLAEELSTLKTEELELLLYLVAAHHGKIRMSLRGTSDDARDDVPDPCPADKRQASGVRDDDELPSVMLPGRETGMTVAVPMISLHLDPMELGLGSRYGRSWRERTQNLLETHGPFRLGWYEALLRVADSRASRRISR
jgi:CRISPR-associated endonuclease/helicase Cas3